jgi:hypothetical protein
MNIKRGKYGQSEGNVMKPFMAAETVLETGLAQQSYPQRRISGGNTHAVELFSILDCQKA